MLGKYVYIEPEMEVLLLKEDMVTTSDKTWNPQDGTVGGGATVDKDSWENVFGF